MKFFIVKKTKQNKKTSILMEIGQSGQFTKKYKFDKLIHHH